jgi:protein-S-isoprenylcysteine O-methyltransferase Ste14
MIFVRRRSENMGCLFEFFFEVFGELFALVFIKSFSAFFPEKYRSKKFIKVVAVILGCLILFALIVGIGVLFENIKSLLGWLLVSICVLYVIAAIIVGSLRDREKENKNEE